VQVLSDGTQPPPTTGNEAPTAVIVINPAEGFAGVTEFNYDARSSSDPNDDDLTYTWAFGDGSPIEAGATTTHTYAAPGFYTVRLTVRDEFNAWDDDTATVVVRSNEGNRAPVAIIGTGPRSGSAPLTITFNGNNSYDLDNDPLTYTWSFRQGTSLIDTMVGPIVAKTFTDEGTYSVQLTVDDGRGASDETDRETIQVTARFVPEPPDDGGTTDGDSEPPAPSYTQRPTGAMCGLGMLMSFLGSWMGLSLLRLSRRRS
jgi:PKD repeat protein